MLSSLGAWQRQRWPKLAVGKPLATGCAQAKAPSNLGTAWAQAGYKTKRRPHAGQLKPP